jgi:hypothetical protein
MQTPRALSLWFIRFAVLVLLGTVRARAGDFPLYEVTFSSPPHTVGMAPVTNTNTSSRDRITAIPFGKPTVVNSFGPLTEQPLEMLASTADGYSQIKLGLSSDAFIVFETDLCVRSSTAQLKGGLTFLFDTPEVRNVYFEPNGDVRIFVPWVGNQVIGRYELDKKTHFRAEIDLVQGLWRIFVNGVLFHKGDFAAQDIQSVRINHDHAEQNNSTAGIDNVFITNYAAYPVMIEQPQSQVVGEGDTVTFSALSHGWELQYQWHFNGVPIPGATGETFTIEHAVESDAGSYWVKVRNINGEGVSRAATLSFDYLPARIQNLSTRLRVETGDNALIAGFILQGTEPKKVIVRAIGPSLQANGTPIPGRLLDPVLQLYNGTGNLIATNDNWGDTQKQEITDSTIPPLDGNESAIVAMLEPGNYSAVVRGKNESTGIAVVELYDLDARPVSKAVNISTRGRVSAGDNVMIGGFILGGHNPAKVLLRGIGPSMSVNGVPLAGRLNDPFLQLHNSQGAIVAVNDNWRDATPEEVEKTGAAPSDDRESAFVLDLVAGSYTVILRDAAGSEGVGLFEAYNLTN